MDSPRLLLVGAGPELSDVQRAFEQAGYGITAVNDDGEALAEVTRECPDLVVMAESAWGCTGLELIGHLWGLCWSPLIILGESSDSADGILYLEMGADMYVTVPFDLEELIVRARNLVRITRRELHHVN